MLHELRLRDYKSYRGETAVPLRRVTVLLGKNSSGKTAAVRLPLLLISALARQPNPRQDPLPLSARGLSYGSSMTELVHGESLHSRFGVGLTAQSDHFGDELVNIDVDIQLRQSLRYGRTSFVTNFAATPSLPEIAWDGATDRPTIEYSDHDVVRFDGIIPQFADSARKQAAERLRHASAGYLSGLAHLTSLRQPLRTLYETSYREDYWDPEGADAPYLLNESSALLERVAGWYEAHVATSIGIAAEPSTFRPVSRTQGGAEHSLALAGQGIQQALPVVTHLTAMTLGSGPQVLVVEEPELNLHPAAHGPIGDLIAEAAAHGGQVLVETHSENLVLRLRLHVASGMLRPEDVNILWFQNRAGDTTIREIEIDSAGAVTEWPRGVFAEDLEEARAIARASRR